MHRVHIGSHPGLTKVKFYFLPIPILKSTQKMQFSTSLEIPKDFLALFGDLNSGQLPLVVNASFPVGAPPPKFPKNWVEVN